MDLALKFFDPSAIKGGKVIFMIGRRGTGKSTVAADFMSYQTHIDRGIVVSETDRMNHFWQKHVPRVFVHHQYTHEITNNILKHQEEKWIKYCKKCMKKGKEPEEGKIDPIFAVYDDVSYDRSLFRNKPMRRLMMNGRHYNILVIITVQYMMDISSDIRGMIDYVVVLKDNNRTNREKIYNHFAGMFPSFASFDATMRACTENMEALVIDNTRNSYNIEECIFFYKARPNLEFRLGSDEFWRFSNENAKGGEEDLDAEMKKLRYRSGLSKTDRERTENFNVRKVYPGQEPDSEEESDEELDYADSVTQRRELYRHMYQENTLPLKTLAYKRGKKRKQKLKGGLADTSTSATSNKHPDEGGASKKKNRINDTANKKRTQWDSPMPKPEPIGGITNEKRRKKDRTEAPFVAKQRRKSLFL